MPCNAKQSTYEVLPLSVATFCGHLRSTLTVFHCQFAVARQSIARRRPPIKGAVLTATTESQKVGNAKPSGKYSAKLVSRKVKKNPTSLHSIFAVRWFALQSKFPLVASRCHVLCARNRQPNTKIGVAWCVSSNEMEAVSRLKLQETRVANISNSTLRS